VIKNVGGRKERRAFYNLPKPYVRVRQKREKKKEKGYMGKRVIMSCAKCQYLSSLSDGD